MEVCILASVEKYATHPSIKYIKSSMNDINSTFSFKLTFLKKLNIQIYFIYLTNYLKLTNLQKYSTYIYAKVARQIG